MNNTHIPSFGFYEAIRILVPGFYFTSLCALYYRTFLCTYIPLAVGTTAFSFLFIFLVLVSSVTIYSKETTKRRRAFLENRPSAFLQDIARRQDKIQPMSETEARQLYFYILNNFIPPPFSEKVFFFGTVYHIMIYIRRSSFWFTILALISLAIQLSRGLSADDLQGLISFCVFVCLIYLLNVKYNKADRKMQENYKDQILWLQMNQDLVNELLRKHDISKQVAGS